MSGTGTLMLADKRRTMFLFTAPPVSLAAPTAAEVTGAKNCGDLVFLEGTHVGATTSESVKEPFINGDPNEAYGQSNYEGNISVARFFDDEGIPEATSDSLWAAVKTKGTKLTIGFREGPDWDADGVKDQEISMYEVVTDNPQRVASGDGYIKNQVPVAVRKAAEFVKVAAGV